jgi:hypothetical protein
LQPKAPQSAQVWKGKVVKRIFSLYRSAADKYPVEANGVECQNYVPRPAIVQLALAPKLTQQLG